MRLFLKSKDVNDFKLHKTSNGLKILISLFDSFKVCIDKDFAKYKTKYSIFGWDNTQNIKSLRSEIEIKIFSQLTYRARHR